MPPAAAPIRKHMPTFHHNDGIAPQIEVPTKITAESRIDARRPNRSASQPHSTEPTTVPHSAANGSQATVAFETPYSSTMPGSTKPSANAPGWRRSDRTGVLRVMTASRRRRKRRPGDAHTTAETIQDDAADGHQANAVFAPEGRCASARNSHAPCGSHCSLQRHD